MAGAVAEVAQDQPEHLDGGITRLVTHAGTSRCCGNTTATPTPCAPPRSAAMVSQDGCRQRTPGDRDAPRSWTVDLGGTPMDFSSAPLPRGTFTIGKTFN